MKPRERMRRLQIVIFLNSWFSLHTSSEAFIAGQLAICRTSSDSDMITLQNDIATEASKIIIEACGSEKSVFCEKLMSGHVSISTSIQLLPTPEPIPSLPPTSRGDGYQQMDEPPRFDKPDQTTTPTPKACRRTNVTTIGLNWQLAFDGCGCDEFHISTAGGPNAHVQTTSRITGFNCEETQPGCTLADLQTTGYDRTSGSTKTIRSEEDFDKFWLTSLHLRPQNGTNCPVEVDCTPSDGIDSDA